MKIVLDYLARLWREEPVRTALAPLILAAVTAGLVWAGVDASVSGILATVVLGGLGLTAQEIARAKVTPVRIAQAIVADAVTPTLSHLSDNVGEVPGIAITAAETLATEAGRRIAAGRHRSGT